MTYDQYLEHHGILGMHWGVRRFQNPDGSLTAAGERRYNDNGSKISKRKQRKAQKRTADHINNEYIHKPNSKKPSTEEYRKAIDAYSSKSKSYSSGKKKTISEHTSNGMIILKGILGIAAANRALSLVGGAAYQAAVKTGNAALEKIAVGSVLLTQAAVTMAVARRMSSELKQNRERKKTDAKSAVA